MKTRRQQILAALVTTLVLFPSIALAEGELVSYGDGDRVTERTLSTGQNMIATEVDTTAEAATSDQEFAAAGLNGPNEGSFVDPSTNS